MIERPEFIDDRDGDTRARALDAVPGGDPGRVAEGAGAPETVRIATAFFNSAGFAEIADRPRDAGADPARRIRAAHRYQTKFIIIPYN